MCELYSLPEFMTLPRRVMTTDKIERHYARMKNRLDFMIEQKCCTQEQHDVWLSLLDRWLADAIGRYSKGDLSDA